MPFYRYGNPGEDFLVHMRMARKATPQPCAMPRFPNDDPKVGQRCSRMAATLCDAPKCDKPICELHRAKHATKPNTDFCPDHMGMSND